MRLFDTLVSYLPWLRYYRIGRPPAQAVQHQMIVDIPLCGVTSPGDFLRACRLGAGHSGMHDDGWLMWCSAGLPSTSVTLPNADEIMADDAPDDLGYPPLPEPLPTPPAPPRSSPRVAAIRMQAVAERLARTSPTLRPCPFCGQPAETNGIAVWCPTLTHGLMTRDDWQGRTG